VIQLSTTEDSEGDPDDEVFDDEVGSTSGFELDAVVDERKPNVMREIDPVFSELTSVSSVVESEVTRSRLQPLVL
jgi:hypothetical protein